MAKSLPQGFTPLDALKPGFTPIDDEQPSALRRAANALEPALKTVRAVAGVYPVAETAANLISGAAAMPIAGIAGLGALAAKGLGADVEPGDVVNKTAGALTYHPRTELGEHLTRSVLYPLEKLAEGARYVGEKTQDATGSAVAATAADTLVQAIPFGLPGMARSASRRRPTEPARDVRQEPTMAPEASREGYTPIERPTEPLAPPDDAGAVVRGAAETESRPGSPEPASATKAQPSEAPAEIASLRLTNDNPPPEGGARARGPEQPRGDAVAPERTPLPPDPIDRIIAESSATLREFGWEPIYDIEPGPIRGRAPDAPAAAPDTLAAPRGRIVRDSQEPITEIDTRGPEERRGVDSAVPAQSADSPAPTGRQVDGDAASIAQQTIAGSDPIARQSPDRSARQTPETPDNPLQRVEPGFRAIDDTPAATDRLNSAPPGSAAMAPGANYVGMVGDSPLAATTRAEKPIRREDILAPFLKALDAPIFEGRIKHPKILGYFLPRKETVRIKNKSDLEVAAHELAHLLDDRVFNGFGTRKGVPKSRPWERGPNAKAFAAELRSVSYDSTKVYEGWAEFVRLALTQPEKARAAAPRFSEWFEGFIQSHKYGPAIEQARAGMLAWYRQDALSRARSKIGVSRDINEHLNRFWDRFRQSTVDDLHGVYRMERNLTGKIESRGAYETARLTRASASLVDGAIRFGYPYRDAKSVTSFKGRGLEQILEPVASKLDDFLMYAVGRSAGELMTQGREHLFTRGEIAAMRNLETPAFRKAFLEYQIWNKGILDFAEQLGVINKASRAAWKRVEYLPFHRVSTSEVHAMGGIQGNWQGIKQLTGGTENIRDVLGNIVQNATMLIDVALKNEARAKVAELAEKTPGGGRFLTRIPPESRMVKIDKEQVQRTLYKAVGIERKPGTREQARLASYIDEVVSTAPHLMDFLVKGQAPTGGNVVAVLRDGKPIYYETVDPVLFRSLTSLQRPAQSALVRLLGIPKRIGQASITLTPDFAIANIARDTIMGAVMSRTGFKPAVDSIRGLASRLRQDPAYKEYLANGGGYSSYFLDEAAFRAHLNRFYADKGINAKTVLDAPDKFLYFAESIFEAFELSTRLGEYKRARAQGEHPSHAAYLAREVSTDFAMKGDSKTLGFLYDTVIFLRPAVVSMDRLFRGFAHDPNRGAIAARSAAIALSSAALYLLNRENPRYQDLEDWDRDSYWHIFVPKPDGTDLHFRYPKIWEIGAMASLAERAVERTIETEPKEYAKDVARVITHQFGLNLMPQAFAPIYEQATNRNKFTGRPIETRGMENLQPFLRSGAGTSETMRALGMATRDLPEALQVNPVRAESILRGYLNTWAMYGLMLSDAALFPDSGPERRFDQYPVVRRFFKDEPPYHTKHERTFYELLNESKRLVGTMRELDRMGHRDLADEKEDHPLAGRAKQLQRVERRLSQIHSEMAQVRASSASPAEKRSKLDELTREKNALVKAVALELKSDLRR